MLLKTRNLIKHYGSSRVLDRVSIDVEEGSCVGVMGRNGAGKTTLFEALENITSFRGQVTFDGMPLKQSAFGIEAGIQFQSTALMDFLTVYDQLAFFAKVYSRKEPLNDLLELLGLDRIKAQKTGDLSGGERQKLLLAIALVNDPKILLLDEPTSKLDFDTKSNIWNLMRSLKRQGKTIIMITHDMHGAKALCDSYILMQNGRISFCGTQEELTRRYSNFCRIQLDPRACLEHIWENFKYRLIDGRIFIYTDTVAATISALKSNGVPACELNVDNLDLSDAIHLSCG